MLSNFTNKKKNDIFYYVKQLYKTVIIDLTGLEKIVYNLFHLVSILKKEVN